MTQVRICGIFDARTTAQRFTPDLIISITDPDPSGSEKIDFSGLAAKVLRLEFHDIEAVTGAFTAPSMSDGVKLKDFLDTEFPAAPVRILIHCHLGLSRSPAIATMALAILRARSGPLTKTTCDDIVDQVFAAAPQAEPNARILTIAEKLVDAPRRALVSSSAARKAKRKLLDDPAGTQFSW